MVLDITSDDIKKNNAKGLKIINKDNVVNNFGEEKNSDYTGTDLCYNSEEGYFYIGENTETVLFDLEKFELVSGVKKASFEIVISSDSTYFYPWADILHLNEVNIKNIGNSYDTTTLTNAINNDIGKGTFYIFGFPRERVNTNVVSGADLGTHKKINLIFVVDEEGVFCYIDYIKKGKVTPMYFSGIKTLGLNINKRNGIALKLHCLRVWKDVLLTDKDIQEMKEKNL